MKVVNPVYRNLESQIKKLAGQLGRKRAAFGALALNEPSDLKDMAGYEQKKGALKEEIHFREQKLEQLKSKRKDTTRHLALKELPEEQKFTMLAPARKQFLENGMMTHNTQNMNLSLNLNLITLYHEHLHLYLRQLLPQLQ